MMENAMARVVSAGALGLLVLTGCYKKHHPFQADDSPVTVRGGSVDFLLLNGKSWAPVSGCAKNTWKVAAENTTVTIGGVKQIISPGNYGLLQTVAATGIKSNWQLTIYFRDNQAAEDPNQTIQLSTNNPCDNTGSISNKLLYLQDEEGKAGSFTSQTPLDPSHDSKWKFDVGTCSGAAGADPRDWKCNHIRRISASASLQFKDVKTGVSITGPLDFFCREGACDIGIDQ